VAFAGGGTPSFGGKIYESVLIKFVEDQVYVDYLTDFQLLQRIAGVETPVPNEVQGSRAIAILVSAPANKHDITVIHPAVQTASGESVCVAHEREFHGLGERSGVGTAARFLSSAPGGRRLY